MSAEDDLKSILDKARKEMEACSQCRKSIKDEVDNAIKYFKDMLQEQEMPLSDDEITKKCLKVIKSLSSCRVPEYDLPADSLIEEKVRIIQSIILKNLQKREMPSLLEANQIADDICKDDDISKKMCMTFYHRLKHRHYMEREPTQEEIQFAALDHGNRFFSNTAVADFLAGIKWYRDWTRRLNEKS